MEKPPHRELEGLPQTIKQAQRVPGGESLGGELTRVRLDKRSTTAQTSYRAAQAQLSAEASRKDTTKDALGAQSIRMGDDADHQALKRAGMVWQRHQTEQKQRWPDWTGILGPALLKVQEEAMAVASTNKPEGRCYTRAVSGLLKTYHLDEIDGATRSNAISIMLNLEAVTDWRAKQKKSERLNHPTTVWRNFILWRDGTKKKGPHSSTKLTKKHLEALQAELDTTRTDYERVKDECETLRRESDAKHFAAPTSTKEDADDLRIPDFLDRTDRRSALATLLASEKLTLQDVPTHTTPAALTKLANELNDLATALRKRGKFEKGRGRQQMMVRPSATSGGLS
jgi:hypothetical protein